MFTPRYFLLSENITKVKVEKDHSFFQNSDKQKCFYKNFVVTCLPQTGFRISKTWSFLWELSSENI